MNGKSFLFGLIIGGVTGTISALLFSPQSGVDTRLALNKTKKQWEDRIAELSIAVKDVAASLQNVSEKGKEEIPLFVNELKQTVQAWLKEIKPNQEKINEQLEQIQISLDQLENELLKDKERKASND